MAKFWEGPGMSEESKNKRRKEEFSEAEKITGRNCAHNHKYKDTCKKRE